LFIQIQHILFKYHPYAGVHNDNFKKIIVQEIQQYGMSMVVTETHLNNFLDLFEKKWAKHLQDLYQKAIEEGEPPVDIIILTSDGGTAHKVVAETLKSELSAQGKSVKIINESRELGKDPLLTMIGFSRSYTFSRIKQQAGDEVLYQALTILNNRMTVFIHDTRMDMLRKKTIRCKNMISLNTFAHDVRLVADGKTVIFDVFDTGLMNGKLIQLARHQVKYDLVNTKFLIHPPEALIKDEQGSLVSVKGFSGFYMTQYVGELLAAKATSFQ
jgi:hypothetical protein